MSKSLKNVSLYLIILLTILFVVAVVRFAQPPEPASPYTYADLLSDLRGQNISKLTVIPDLDIVNSGKAEAQLINGLTHTVPIPSMDVFMTYAQQHYFDDPYLLHANAPPKPGWFMQMLPMLIVLLVSVFILLFILQQVQGGGGGNRAMSFGKTKARISIDDKRKVTFAQVAGLDEEKAELAEIVDFLKTPKKYTDIGARIPKGVLLVGPPGTGKTYLARAVAGESDVPFYSISGSDFVEMFVGVGASRVRDLFEQAKKNPASIIIIDEIDAVGRRRGAGLGGGHDEREQTLNQLLVEMDGFGVNEGVIVLAATNRPDILDPALLRPGRFDRRIVVNKPDTNGREAVLHVHAKDKELGGDVNLRTIAQTTAGFTPADLENLLNESALMAARENKKRIDMDSVRKAFIKVGIGMEKRSRVIPEKVRRMTAYHEAGHAICFELMSELDQTYIVSVIPVGRAGGYVMPLPKEDREHYTKKFMQQTIVAALGGRAAEALVLNDITTGASSDIEKATSIARDMVVKYGMSETLGPIQFGSENEEVFLGRDFHHQRNYGEQVASLIDNEIKRIVEDGYNEAYRILEQHIDILHQIAELLIDRERVSGEEIRRMFPMGVLPEKESGAEKLLGNPIGEF